MEKEELTFEQFCDPAYRRTKQIEVKSEATWVAFMETKGVINKSGIAREYFKRSPGWMTQRINGNTVFGKTARFRESEYHQLAEAFRDIAKRLNAHADEIDAAVMEQLDD